jgi:hypothetical protein
VIGVESVLPNVVLNKSLISEIQNYVFNEYYDLYLGGIVSKKDYSKQAISFIKLDANAGRNTILVPMNSQNEITDSIQLEVLRYLFKNIKQCSPESYLGLINYFLIFDQKENSTNSLRSSSSGGNRIKGKLFISFPNISLDLKRIGDLKLSSNSLNKYLTKKSANVNYNKELIEYGYLTMSSEHRIIALLNQEEALQQILFGIWLNFPDESFKKKPSEEMLESFLAKNKLLIYEKCSNFIYRSNKIDEINTPSVNEGVFLMILFISGIPFYYEVKGIPNEKERTSTNEFSNEWLILKKEFSIEKGKSETIEINTGMDKGVSIESMSRFINKKFNNLQTSTASVVTSTRSKNNFKDPLNEIFEMDDDSNKNYPMNYDYPLSRKVIPKQNNFNTVDIDNNKHHKRMISGSEETLTISSSKGTSMVNSQTGNSSNTLNNSRHKKHLSLNEFKNSNDVTLKVFKCLQQSQFKDNPISSQIIKIPKPVKHNRSDIPETPTNPSKLISYNLDSNSGIKSAFDIIFDQAKNIQVLQDKVMSLQSELEKVVLRLKLTSEERGSICSSCQEKKNTTSAGTNTSFEISKSNDNQNTEVNNNSMKLTKKDSTLSQKQADKCEDDEKSYRYNNFLNENSINFPKQFLDIHSGNFELNDNFDNIHYQDTLFTPQHGAGNNFIDLTQNQPEQSRLITVNITPKNQMTNFDITDTSIDPPSGRLFLKVPSMYKNNNSLLFDNNDYHHTSTRHSAHRLNVTLY